MDCTAILSRRNRKERNDSQEVLYDHAPERLIQSYASQVTHCSNPDPHHGLTQCACIGGKQRLIQQQRDSKNPVRQRTPLSQSGRLRDRIKDAPKAQRDRPLSPDSA